MPGGLFQLAPGDPESPTAAMVLRPKLGWISKPEVMGLAAILSPDTTWEKSQGLHPPALPEDAETGAS